MVRGQTYAMLSGCASLHVDRCHAVGVFMLIQVQSLRCSGVSGCVGMGGMSLSDHGRTGTWMYVLTWGTCPMPSGVCGGTGVWDMLLGCSHLPRDRRCTVSVCMVV